MLRWLVLVALVVASCVSAADAQQRDSSKDFTLATGPGHGIWSDGSTMWMLQPGGSVDAYKMSDKSRDSSKDYGGLPAATDPVGFWSYGSTIYLTDNINDQILAYHTSDKSRDSSKDITLASGNNGPAGIYSNGNTMWVADHDDDMIYAYKMSDKSRDSSKDITLASGNDLPWGIWSNGNTMWVADINAFKIYAYNISTKSHDSSKDITLASGHRSLDIWSNGNTMWVLDFTDAKIYAYRMPSTGGGGGGGGSSTGSTSIFFLPPPPPRDTTPPTVLSVERTGNATTADRALTWNVTFSESVVVSADARINYTSVANVTIPDLGAVHDTVLVDVPGVVTGGSISVDLHHPITSGLLIELVAPDCNRFVIHNQTTAFLYKLRQPRDLGDLAGVGAAGQWTLHVSDHAKHWNGTLNTWSLELESDGAVEGSGDTYAITRYVAGPGNHTLSLDGYEVRDRAGNPLADTEPAVNEPYHVVGAAARTCQTE